MVRGGIYPRKVAREHLGLTVVRLGLTRVLSTAVSGEQRLLPAARGATTPGRLMRIGRWLHVHMTDEVWIAAVATIPSIAFFAWYDAHGLTSAFNDARIRELISRRWVVSRPPGLAQLGTTWLPLPSLLTVPFIWNGPLFRDGIASSLPSMLAFV